MMTPRSLLIRFLMQVLLRNTHASQSKDIFLTQRRRTKMHTFCRETSAGSRGVGWWECLMAMESMAIWSLTSASEIYLSLYLLWSMEGAKLFRRETEVISQPRGRRERTKEAGTSCLLLLTVSSRRICPSPMKISKLVGTWLEQIRRIHSKCKCGWLLAHCRETTKSEMLSSSLRRNLSTALRSTVCSVAPLLSWF